MKKFVALLLAFSGFLLSACNGGEKLAEISEYTADGFVDPNTGVEYVTARGGRTLYAVTAGEKYLTAADTAFYTVEFEEKSKFLCLPDNGENLLYRAKDVEEPDVVSFEPVSAGIYNSGNARKMAQLYADDEYLPDELKGRNPSQDTALCRELARAVAENEQSDCEDDEIDSSTLRFVRLYSQKYPGLYYLLAVYGDTYGRYFVRDRYLGKSVICPREISVRIYGRAGGNTRDSPRRSRGGSRAGIRSASRKGLERTPDKRSLPYGWRKIPCRVRAG